MQNPKITSDARAIQRTYDIIANNRYLSLATTDGNHPWIAPIAYVADRDYSLYFYSAITSKHITDIARKPTVACAIFDSTKSSDDADGIQMIAAIKEVPVPDLLRVMELYFRLSFPDPDARARWMRPVEDFCGDAPQRFYQLIPTNVYIPDLDVTGIDQRLEIDIDKLTSKPFSY